MAQTTDVVTTSGEDALAPANFSLNVDGFLGVDPDPGFRYGATVTGTFEGVITARGTSRNYRGETDLDYTIEIKSIVADGEPGEPPLVEADTVTLSFDGSFELAGDPGFIHGRPVSGRFVARVDGDRTSVDFGRVRRVYRLTVTDVEVEGIERKAPAPASDSLPGVVAAVFGRPVGAPSERRRGPVGRFFATPIGSFIGFGLATATVMGSIGTVLALIERI